VTSGTTEAGLIRHLEDHLGRITRGWRTGEHGGPLPFDVVELERSPLAGVKVLSTVGLSKTPLCVAGATKHLRQEYVAMFRESDGARNMPALLQQIGTEALAKGRGHMIGDVLGPRGPLRAGATVSALYVAMPVYLPESFASCREGDEAIVFAWLVPITAAEAHYIREHGSHAFEDLMERLDPDVLDLERQGIV
jgi:hypothetical protein